MRRQWLSAACFVVLVTTAATQPRPRHAVVLLIDDLGYGDTGHMGAEFATPAIDALALDGIRLNQSYVMQLCSPTRSSLVTSRYPYNIGMDGNVLVGGDARCVPTNVSTVGDQMSANGVATAFIGKYDVGYSSWACTANCRGFGYWLGYYGAAEDYYLHGSASGLDFHENFEQAPQYRGEYSTTLFTQKASEWIGNLTRSGGHRNGTYLHLAYQAVHGPIEAPPAGESIGCSGITEPTRKTYCAMVQAVDRGIANLTATYRTLGLFNDTVWLFLSDNGGTNQDGGFNVPLRGQKATVWEGGVRSQTFLHWAGFAPRLKGSVYSGLAHVADWGVTLVSALGHTPTPRPDQTAFDGVDLWDALVTGGPSPRTEMLLSMRDADLCPDSLPGCSHRGQLAYRRGPYKLIYGHTALRGKEGDECGWGGPTSNTASPNTAVEGAGVTSREGGALNCWNGWGRPKDVGPSRPPVALPPAPGQPPNTSIYSWGTVLLFDIESDPLEEHDIAAEWPNLVAEMLQVLVKFNASHISQDVMPASGVHDTEPCGQGLKCAVPWLPSAAGDRCSAAPTPVPPPPSPPSPPQPPSHEPSHLTLPDNWVIEPHSLGVHGWACYLTAPPKISLVLDGGAPIVVVAAGNGRGPCPAGSTMGLFAANLTSAASTDLTKGLHKVAGVVLGGGGQSTPLGASPACVDNAKPSACP